MARFFFHTVDGRRDRDTTGTELPDAVAARVAAIRYAGDLLSDQPDMLWDGSDFRVEVTDEQSKLVCTIITIAVDAQGIEEGA